ncbi:MAG: DNA polymerase subunit beta [Methanobrevibacter sp.]|uniref:DNA polymerase subunit beta n=1 Tax=Methanobrevibacter sp. TaxID=66852 RepID=UPI0025E5518F|nr:DNA polymerase subunit beta [Methanobrevibacter sp.]MBR0271927.1 DNA polymerase subunit beta [Methanobrevibacter sp.]
MQVRTRDFIYTTDGMYFASTNYIHPEDRYISFLRYIPDENGDREKDGIRYRKVGSEEAYSYLRENYPDYLYFCDVTNVEMMGVPIDKVERVIKPENRLLGLKKTFESGGEVKNPEIIAKLMDVCDFFHYIAGIDYEDMGISGSILPGLQKEDVSDLDYVIYGLDNHRKAIEAFKKHRNEEVYIEEVDKHITLNGITDDYWDFVYNKRMSDSSLTPEEFKWYENRKANRGTINGTLFDILATKGYDEIKGSWGDTRYEPQGIAKIECDIVSALGAFDNPSLYTIENLEVLEGVEKDIVEVVSFTHTYAGEVVDGEHVIAKGKVEKVIQDGKEDYYRLVVGTTREAIDEYLKLKIPPA